MTQLAPTSDRAAASIARRDDAIRQVDAGADDAWKEAAIAAIRRMAVTRRDFIADEVWEATGLPRPREARAMGPVIRRAVSLGYIEKTADTRPSNASNQLPMTVWRSLVFGGGPA